MLSEISTIKIPEFISDMIEEMWGEKLNPEEHVSRIIDDVKKITLISATSIKKELKLQKKNKTA